MNFQKELQNQDEWLSESDESGIFYLRCVLLRARPGMQDFLLKMSIPKTEKPTVITTRVSKSQCNAEGYTKIADTLLKGFQEKDNKFIKWSNVNIEHLGTMLSAELKFFAQNPNSELLRFVTEALKLDKTAEPEKDGGEDKEGKKDESEKGA